MKLPPGLHASVREVGEQMIRVGWEYQGQARSGHLKFRHSDHGGYDLALTPGGDLKKWAANHRSQLAGRMGISKGQLDRRLGLREPKKSPKPKRKRNRNEVGVRHREVWSHQKSPVEAEPVRNLERIAEEIERRSHEINLLSPASADYQDALNDLSRLRAEYLEREGAAA